MGCTDGSREVEQAPSVDRTSVDRTGVVRGLLKSFVAAYAARRAARGVERSPSTASTLPVLPAAGRPRVSEVRTPAVGATDVVHVRPAVEPPRPRRATRR